MSDIATDNVKLEGLLDKRSRPTPTRTTVSLGKIVHPAVESFADLLRGAGGYVPNTSWLVRQLVREALEARGMTIPPDEDDLSDTDGEGGEEEGAD